MDNEEETHDDLKYLLGNMGVEIFYAIVNGARNFETIKLFSGIPIACIRGRVPVLLNLKLIEEQNEEYSITKKGRRFKQHLDNKNRY
ncbi:MAG: hypothetical protein GF317_01850 [Candidatus Lokiarchaeota archaeon]|nr:hypothetical protein [Candidatus Lokiarchaeota archaeon]MBD3198684.1 hypothetical protein [Candidatus Lokiarchaeota archaeon]